MKILLIKKIIENLKSKKQRADEWYNDMFDALYEQEKIILYKIWKQIKKK